MKELLLIYAILPIVYFMHRAGELAVEKGYRPVRWQLRAYFTVLFGGFILPFAVSVASLIVRFEVQNKFAIISTLSVLYIAGVLIAGFTLLPNLKNRKSLSENKRTYRAYDLKNAFLFPRVIPRGGFLWRTISYWILMHLFSKLLELASLPFRQSAIATIFVLVVFLGLGCFGLLYFLSHICVPRIRDASLSRDTLILLFFPVLGQIALLMLFATPTRTTGRSSI
jgi:uncharacterized membrane protein YhaH (DUF805 family)